MIVESLFYKLSHLKIPEKPQKKLKNHSQKQVKSQELYILKPLDYRLFSP